MPKTKLDFLIKGAKFRISESGRFTTDVLEAVITEMKEEGTPDSVIMAHLDLLDIDDRT
tara:strand:+ start:12252 stop:12428 length:177 start_codon:yes stop_codon:yes gene_type:complete